MDNLILATDTRLISCKLRSAANQTSTDLSIYITVCITSWSLCCLCSQPDLISRSFFKSTHSDPPHIQKNGGPLHDELQRPVGKANPAMCGGGSELIQVLTYLNETDHHLKERAKSPLIAVKACGTHRKDRQ